MPVSYDLLDLPPENKQALMAEVLRRRGQSNALVDASQQANQFNTMAAIAQMANNPDLAAAAQLAMKNQQNQYKPASMGQMGFAVPGTGEFIPSPMYADEKRAQREAKADLERSRADERRERDQSRQDFQREMFENRRSLSLTLKSMGRGGGEAAADKAAAKAEKAKNTSVQKLSTSLEKAGVPEFESALEIAEGRLKQHKEGELPGYGRFLGAVSTKLLPEDAQLARADMQAAANILLKSRSGAAVTTPEERRFLQEVATGAGMTEKAMRHGWKNLRKNFNARRANLLSAVTPEELQEYNERSGTTYEQGKSSLGGATPATPSWLPPGAKIIGVREK